MPAPDVIVHSTSSGGTQAGLVAGCRLLGLPTRVIGVSADDSSSALQTQVNAIVTGIGNLLQLDPAALAAGTAIEVDDRFVGGGYGVPIRRNRAKRSSSPATLGSDIPGSHLHVEGDGGPHRVRERRRVWRG